MQEPLQALHKVVELLKLEKTADYEQFKALIQSLSLSERKEKGYTWYPLEVIKSGYTYGDRAFVIVEKTTTEAAPSRFRSGKIVNLFTSQENVYKPERSGVINYVQRGKMKIVLNSTDIPDWINKGAIGVDLMFDERSYLEMERAMKLVIEAKKDRLAELRSIILGKQAAMFSPISNPIHLPSLNASQNDAVNQILAAKDVAIVHGPPGTGKTTTLVQAIKLLSKSENTVLVTAPSNAAVDLLTERLHTEALNVVRVGNISRVDESIINQTLDARLSKHPESKNIKKVKIEAAGLRRKAGKFKRNFGRKEREERQALYKEAKELTAWANQLEDRLIDQILTAAQVITCTLVGSTHKILHKLKFKTVVIDEAAQALEPATWIPISKASKVVLAGDPFQLPPTVKSREAQKKGFNITMLEKRIEQQEKVNLLNIQYRMHQSIMGFSNQQFYNNKLQAADSVKEHRLSFDKNTPLVFIDTAGCSFDEQINPEYQSRFNPDEFNILQEHLYQLIEGYGEIKLPSIAIISPYREQVIYMNKTVEEDPLLKDKNIKINTIDGFQGQEQDVIYISLVRSNSKGEIGFLSDTRRMNVAMTRAKKKLIIIGDSATIGRHPFYEAFLLYSESHGTYQSAWEYMQ